MDAAKLIEKVQRQGGIFEIIRFVIVGGLATLTDITVSTLLFLFTALHENPITTIAFGVAFFVSYYGHRYFTFKKQGSMLRFFALAFAMLVLRNLIVYFLVTYWMRGLVPILLSMIIVTGITYVLSKFAVFED